VDDYVDTNAPFGFGLSESFTCEFWLFQKSGSDNTDSPDVVGKGKARENTWTLWVRDNTDLFFELNDNDITRFTTSASITKDAWFHIAGVYDASEQEGRIYVNGTLEGQVGTSNANGGWDRSQSVKFAKRLADTGRWFDGFLSEARIWNTARTQQQIQNNMNTRLTGTESGLVGYWRLDDTTKNYMHFPYRIQLPRDEDEASGSLAHVEVDAVDRRVVEAIRNISGVPNFDLIVANVSDPDNPTIEIEWPTFSLANARYDATSVKGDLVLELLEQEPFPSSKFDPARFPGIF